MLKKKSKQPKLDKKERAPKKKKNQKGVQSEESIESTEVNAYQSDLKPTIWDLISPDGITIDKEDRGRIKQTLGKVVHFLPFYIPRSGYPRKLQTNWINTLLSAGEVDVMIDIHKLPKGQAIRSLQKQLTVFQSNLSWQMRRGNTDQINDLRTKIGDTEVLVEEIQFSENDMFLVSVLGNMYAKEERELEALANYLQDEMGHKFFSLTSAWSRVKKGFLSSQPVGENQLKDTFRNIDRRALSTLSPFISGAGRYYGGVPIGINRITGHKEFINTFGNEEFRPTNYNMAFFGISGSGKSVAMKLMIGRQLAGANTHFLIIDPEGEFKRLTNRLQGINIDLHEESGIVINPCAINYSDIPLDDVDDDELSLLEEDDQKEVISKNGKKYLRFVPIKEKINEILDFFNVLVSSGGVDKALNVFERNFLEEAITYVFTEVLGITSHPSSLFQDGMAEVDGELVQSRVRKPEPELLQIYEYLYEKYSNDQDCKRLLAALKPFLRTGSKPIFDGQTRLGHGVTQSLESARLVNFNISGMEEGLLKPVAYHVLINYAWEHFAKNIEKAEIKKYIVADEIWQSIDNDATVSFYEKVARRARKRNCGLMYASQDFVRLLENKKARGIVTSTFTIFFMQQNPIDLKKIRDHFDLAEGEINTIFSNTAKGECIVRFGDNRIWMRTDPSEGEMMYIESNEALLKERLDRKRMQERQTI